jgi:hypothetical protein
MQKLINRIKSILFHPNTVWENIETGATTEKEIFQQYLVFIAAVPAIAGLLGSLFVGEIFLTALFWALLFFSFSIATIWASAKVLTFFASSFKVKQDYVAALKLTTYTFTPILLACVFFLIPPIYGLSILGIYGFYLFWIGLPKMLPCLKEELFNFRFIGMIVIAIAMLIIFILPAVISGITVYFLSI